jgi:hypothetical protein
VIHGALIAEEQAGMTRQGTWLFDLVRKNVFSFCRTHIEVKLVNENLLAAAQGLTWTGKRP